MKMFCDLCVDSFEESRETTWKNVYKKLKDDKYFVTKFPAPPPKIVAPPVAKKVVAKKRPARVKKMGAG